LIEPYDVQETRRLEREKNQAEFQTEREKTRLKEIDSIRKLKLRNMSDEDIADVLSIPIDVVRNETGFSS
jgi:hypothetical protein